MSQKKPHTPKTVSVVVSMGASGPTAKPDPARAHPGDTVEWKAKDDGQWWMVIMEGDEKTTPFPNGQRSFKGKGKPKGAKLRGDLSPGPKGTPYKYWLIYEAPDGEIHAADPKIMLEDPKAVG